MQSILKLSLLSIIFLFTGCFTPKPDAMKREVSNFRLPKLPSNGNAMVYIVRPEGLGNMIKFNVFVDNKKAQSEQGYTNGKQYIYFPVSVGKHLIISKAKNWATLSIYPKANDIIFIEQKPKASFPLPMNSLIKLPNYEGKYHVKHLQLGTILK